MRGKYYVYALFEGTQDNIKYVGYTSKTPTIRFTQHVGECTNKKTPKEKWLFTAISSGKAIGVIQLGCYKTMEEALAKESLYIMEYGKVHKLTNSSKGGEAGGRSKGSRNTHKKTIREAIRSLFNNGILVPSNAQISKETGLSIEIVNKYNKTYEGTSRS